MLKKQNKKDEENKGKEKKLRFVENHERYSSWTQGFVCLMTWLSLLDFYNQNINKFQERVYCHSYTLEVQGNVSRKEITGPGIYGMTNVKITEKTEAYSFAKHINTPLLGKVGKTKCFQYDLQMS